MALVLPNRPAPGSLPPRPSHPPSHSVAAAECSVMVLVVAAWVKGQWRRAKRRTCCWESLAGRTRFVEAVVVEVGREFEE